MKGVCGLGHRLVRNAKIYHLARQAGLAVGVTWFPWAELFVDRPTFFAANLEDRCAIRFSNEPQEREVVDPIDRPPTIAEYSSDGLPTGARFDFEGCADEKYWRKEVFGPAALEHVADFHGRLLRQLRPARQESIDAFAADRFGSRRVVAIHLRTGNGEGGDFAQKAREPDVEIVLSTFAERMALLDPTGHVVFVASDSPEPAKLLRERLHLDVVAWPSRLAQQGVATGDWTSGETPLDDLAETRAEQTFDIYADLVLLAMADDLYLGQWSSLLSGPVALNRRRQHQGTSIWMHDRDERAWREV